MIKILENAILATDLALYFKFRGQFMQLVNENKADWNREYHRDLLRSMMMTACDVAAIAKPWPQQKRVRRHCTRIIDLVDYKISLYQDVYSTLLFHCKAMAQAEEG